MSTVMALWIPRQTRPRADNGTALEKPATNPIGTSQAEPMDLRGDSASKPVALGASLDVAVAIPIASSQSEAMDISDGP
jgi:hypothetical protein